MVIKFQLLKNCKIKFCKEGKNLYLHLTIFDHFHFKITPTLINRENLEKSAFLHSLSKEKYFPRYKQYLCSLFPLTTRQFHCLPSATLMTTCYKPGQYRDSFSTV